MDDLTDRPAPIPRNIEADRRAGTLKITWDDGHTSAFEASKLRWACPCAICRGEWGRPGRLDSVSRLPPDELLLADVRLVGSYGITPVWASGHDTGIYSFDYLRSLCACEECAASTGRGE